jgi:hypothetical protein
MNRLNFHIDNESGSVTIITAIMILVIITLVGLSAMNTTTVELQIAGNDQLNKIAFYSADSGVYGIPKIVARIVETSDPVVIGGGADSIADGVNWNDDEGIDADTFFDQIMGYEDYDNTPDVLMDGGGFDTTIDVERIEQRILAGGGAEFASGVEGIGVGSTGGVAIYYELDSIGRSARNARSTIIADYRKVVGVPGGL